MGLPLRTTCGLGARAAVLGWCCAGCWSGSLLRTNSIRRQKLNMRIVAIVGICVIDGAGSRAGAQAQTPGAGSAGVRAGPRGKTRRLCAVDGPALLGWGVCCLVVGAARSGGILEGGKLFLWVCAPWRWKCCCANLCTWSRVHVSVAGSLGTSLLVGVLSQAVSHEHRRKGRRSLPSGLGTDFLPCTCLYARRISASCGLRPDRFCVLP